MKFFEGWVSLFSKDANKDTGLKAWAKIEYKEDSEFAYHYIREHGVAPSIGVRP